MKSLAARLNEIQQDLDAMFEHVHIMLSRVADELKQSAHDPNYEGLHRLLAEKIKLVDELDVRIEGRCLTFLALQQPVASDLRKIIAVSRIIVDLDRMADNCVDISQRLGAVSGHEQIELPQLIVEMAEIASDTLTRVIAAYRKSDAGEAQRIRAEDDIMDNLCRHSIDEIIDAMEHQKWESNALLDIFSIVRQLERIADHASGISEEVIFLVEGRIVRHEGN